MDSGDGAQEREDEGISEEGNRHDAGASSPSRSSSDVRRTLTAVNMFVSQTAEFLNAFAQRCDEKLGALQYKIKAVEADLLLLEAKLDSIDGLESRPRALQNADPVVGVQSGRKSKEEMPLESVANGNHGDDIDVSTEYEEEKEVCSVDNGLGLDEKRDSWYNEVVQKHAPELRKYFKLLKMGMPVEQIRSKVEVDATVVGFDPASIVADLEKLGNALQKDGPDTMEGNEVVDEVDPSMAVYARMLKMGVPKASVRQKMQMDGISNFSILER